jgi:hypothetical protein
MTTPSTLSTAVTVAERGCWSIVEISPSSAPLPTRHRR